jgi:DNA-binding transcriptional MocR family regulator
MQFWRVRFDRGRGPLYLALADAIAAAIDAGDLRPGDRLPPQRQLAQGVGVDLTTVTRAYAEAHRRGYTDAAVGRGTFVRGDASASASPVRPTPPPDMSMNMPPLPASPSLREVLRQGLDAVLREADMAALMTYHLGAGSADDRAVGAEWLEPVLGTTEPARVLVCTGVQTALTALLTLLAKPGDVILTETLTYPRFRAAAMQFGLRLHAVEADEDGLLPDALDAACRALAPKAIYCTPTIHNPTTVTMPLARRRAIAAVAERHGLVVIEDDAYGMLPQTPLPAITTFAPGVGYYLGTLSKCLSPGLRIAYAIAPGRSEATRLEAAIRATSLMVPPLMAALVSRLIRQGEATALRDGVREEIRARQAIVREVLPPGSFRAHPDGPHLWLPLPAQWHRIALSAHLRTLGLAVAPSDAFSVVEPAPEAVRISVGAASSRAALHSALTAVAAVLVSDMPPALTDIV